MGLGSQFLYRQPVIQQKGVDTALQTPLGLQQEAALGAANQQQFPISSISQLQQPIQQLASQLSQALLKHHLQASQSSFQSLQQAIAQLQQHLQLMQQAIQQQVSYIAKQQIAPQAAFSTLGMPYTVYSALPVNTKPLVPLTCNWTEYTSPEGYKYYYDSVTKESKWEKPEEFTMFEQQQQQQQLILATQQLQFPSLSTQQVPQMEQAQPQMHLNQQPQLQLLQPSLSN